MAFFYIKGSQNGHFVVNGVLENVKFFYKGGPKNDFLLYKCVLKLQYICVGGSQKWHFVV